jgi:hypothetical protein
MTVDPCGCLVNRSRDGSRSRVWYQSGAELRPGIHNSEPQRQGGKSQAPHIRAAISRSSLPIACR